MLKKKMNACIELAKSKAKFIPKEQMGAVAKKFGLKTHVLVRAWQNFKASGGKIVDRRTTTGSGYIRLTPSIPARITKARSLTLSEASEIIRDFMDAHSITMRDFCNQHEIPAFQLYGMIREMDIHGTLLGTKVLSAKECGSVYLVDTIHLYRKPKTQRKSISRMSAGEVANNKRIASILYKHLSANIT